MIDVQNQTVWVNYMIDRKSRAKIRPVDMKFMEILGNLDIKNYTSLDRIVIVLVVLKPEEEERLIHRKKENKFEIRINLDYQALKNTDEKQTLQLIAETYLLAIERFLSQRKDFDSDRFYQDVKMLFTENGFL